MRVTFIGFGEAARAFADSLSAVDPGLAFSAYDILFDAQGLEGEAATAARRRDVSVLPTAREAAEGADWVVSAVTAASSLEAAASVRDALGPGQVLIDINSVSPGRKRETERLVAARGAAYVDMAVMAPVHPRGHRTPVLVAGRLPPRVAQALDRLGFDYEVVGDQAGEATAIKMVRSLFVKGLEAVAVTTLVAAEASGCLDRVLASLAKSYPGLDWPGFASYQLERVATHGVRRAAEMRESGRTLDELGFGGDLARAVAAVQDEIGLLGLGSVARGDLGVALRTIGDRLAPGVSHGTAERRSA